jgi:hypothetical protein
MSDDHAERLRVLRSPEMKAMLPALTAYAARCMRITQMRDGTEVTLLGKGPDEYALDAVLAWVDGTSVRRPDEDDLGKYLRSVIKSQVNAAWRKAARRNAQGLEAADEVAASSPPTDEHAGAREAVAKAEQILHDDPKAKALFDVVADSDPRATYAEYAEKLGCEERDVKNSFARMIGGIVRAGIWDKKKR